MVTTHADTAHIPSIPLPLKSSLTPVMPSLPMLSVHTSDSYDCTVLVPSSPTQLPLYSPSMTVNKLLTLPPVIGDKKEGFSGVSESIVPPSVECSHMHVGESSGKDGSVSAPMLNSTFSIQKHTSFPQIQMLLNMFNGAVPVHESRSVGHMSAPTTGALSHVGRAVVMLFVLLINIWNGVAGSVSGGWKNVFTKVEGVLR